MALFDFFKREANPAATGGVEQAKPDITEDVFTYKDNDFLRPKLVSSDATLEGVYNYLRGDYQNRGYADCLTNSEPTYREENITVLLLDLELLIDQTVQKYRDELREIDFHVQSRGDEGLTNLVSQLEVRKEVINEYLEKLKLFHNDAMKREGTALKIIKSYAKGFQRGMVALSSSQILKTNIDNE